MAQSGLDLWGTQPKCQPDEDGAFEETSEEAKPSGGSGTGGASRKPARDVERMARRRQINRESARRIRARKFQEVMKLKQEIASHEDRYTEVLQDLDELKRDNQELMREKTRIMQQCMATSERLHAATAANLELQGLLQLWASPQRGSGPGASSWGSGSFGSEASVATTEALSVSPLSAPLDSPPLLLSDFPSLDGLAAPRFADGRAPAVGGGGIFDNNFSKASNSVRNFVKFSEDGLPGVGTPEIHSRQAGGGGGWWEAQPLISVRDTRRDADACVL